VIVVDILARSLWRRCATARLLGLPCSTQNHLQQGAASARQRGVVTARRHPRVATMRFRNWLRHRR
jgi:hypothetical protein